MMLLSTLLLAITVLRAYSQVCSTSTFRNVGSMCSTGFDLSSNCDTCVGAESISCAVGAPDCSVGDFTFSALFLSYDNPMSMCGECGANEVTITCQQLNDMTDGNGLAECFLRFVYCLRPYGTPESDVPLCPQTPLTRNDRFIFQEGFMVQGTVGDPNFWNRSNPFTRELEIWPGRAQLYVVVYTFRNTIPRIVDRLLIDLELGVNFTQRRTYSGRLNITQFDLSFRVDGQCAEHYFGPQCNVFCFAMEERLTCDSEGNIVCMNSKFDPETRCTECIEIRLDPVTGCTECVDRGRDPGSNCTECKPGLDPGTDCTECIDRERDSENNCGDTIVGTTTDSVTGTTTAPPVECTNGKDPATNCTQCFTGRDPSTDCVACLPGMHRTSPAARECIAAAAVVASDVNSSLYGAIGGLSGCVVLLCIALAVVVCVLCHRKTSVPTQQTAGDMETMAMTPNQVYGVPLSKEQEDIAMEDNVGYGVTSDSNGHNPLQEDSYDYI